MGNALEGSAGQVDVMIIGGGPTGIGAAYRLNQYNNDSWILLDAEKQPGGLAGSIRTHEGFRFDHGYKTFSSRYEYTDRVLEDCYNGESSKLKERNRDCYVCVKGRMVRFPLQNNLSGLPKTDKLNCVLDLLRARIIDETRDSISSTCHEFSGIDLGQLQHVEGEDVENDDILRPNTEEQATGASTSSMPTNEIAHHDTHIKTSKQTLDDYLIRRWGESICNIVFRPYIFKTFAYPTSKMTSEWADYKILPAQVGRDIDRMLEGEQCDPGLDSEATFLYPLKGGLVSMWRHILRKLPKDNIRFKSEIIDFDVAEKTVRTKDGLEIRYETLISTMPLTSLLELAGRADLNESLIYSSLYIICLGVRGTSPHKDITGCIYFPESDCVFHRATIFSSFDPDSVPDQSEKIPTMRFAKETQDSKSGGNSAGPYWSIMLEVSAGPLKTISDATIMDEVIRDAVAVGLLRANDEIVSIHMTEMTHGHPLPTLEAETKVDEALAWLQTQGIYSRGRFGAFKYHVGDLDHCFIQGVEAADSIVNGSLERCVWTPAKDMNCKAGTKIQYPVYDLDLPDTAETEHFTAGEVRKAITREPSYSTSSYTSTSSPISRTSSQLDDASPSDSETSASTKEA